MRIAMIAPLELRVPPVAYGGTELVVSLLTEELVRRGHEVTLFASGDSVTKAKLVSVCERYLRHSSRDIGLLTLMSVARCLEESDSFDIIHNHTTVEGLALAGLVDIPVLSTLHGVYNGDLGQLFQSYKGWYCTISESAKSFLPPKDRFAGVVHNAIDCDSYPFNQGPREDYLLFLSRMSVEKGPHIAIEVARRLGRRLVIAGNADNPADQEYFRTQVLPKVDGDMVRYVGEADYIRKRVLLSQAYCLLAPITWPEPFGLFMAEAMVCGTPVVAFRRGSAPELIDEGVTGFVADTSDEMVKGVQQIDAIDRRQCRARARHRFNVERMTDGYLAAYARVLEASLPGMVAPSTSLTLAEVPLSVRSSVEHADGGSARRAVRRLAIMLEDGGDPLDSA